MNHQFEKQVGPNRLYLQQYSKNPYRIHDKRQPPRPFKALNLKADCSSSGVLSCAEKKSAPAAAGAVATSHTVFLLNRVHSVLRITASFKRPDSARWVALNLAWPGLVLETQPQLTLGIGGQRWRRERERRERAAMAAITPKGRNSADVECPQLQG